MVFVGQPGDRGEDPVIDDIAQEEGIIDLTGRTDLAQLLDLMNHAQLVVSNDTGPAHLSIALGRPTVVIVGGGHFGSFVPYPKEITPPTARFVYKKMECYHCFWRCHLRASKHQIFPCVGGIGEERVWDACEALLGAGPGAP